MTPSQTESAILDQLVPELEAQGYEVFVNPRRELLPAFLEGFRPDAIALGRKKKLAIEIVTASRGRNEKIRTLEDRFKDQSDWEFRLIWVSPTTANNSITRQPRETIASSIGGVRSLIDHGHTAAALLMCWATFEATARAMHPETFSRPQTPARLVETLAKDGTITPTEADLLRRLSQQRNRLIHGDISLEIENRDVVKFAEILDSLGINGETNNLN